MKKADDANIHIIRMLHAICKRDLDNGHTSVSLQWITDTLDSAIKAMEKGDSQ
jgi:hypothetical protein